VVNFSPGPAEETGVSPLSAVHAPRPVHPRVVAAARLLLGDAHDRDGARLRLGRLSGLLFVLGNLYGQLVMPFLREPQSGLRWMEGIGWLTAVLLLVLPWRRMPPWTLAVSPVWAVVVLSVTAGGMSGALEHYGAVYGLLFAYVGLTMRPGRPLRLAALAVVGVAGAALLGRQQDDLVQICASIMAAATVGELMTLGAATLRHARTEVQLLHASLSRLIGARSEPEAAQLTATLAHQLLSADASMLLLAEEPGSSVLVGRGGTGLGADFASVRIDSAVEQSGVGTSARAGKPLFIPDAPGSPLFAQRFLNAYDVTSILYIPVPGEGGTMGVLAVWWSSPQRTLDAFRQQAVELLSTEAGLVLGRLREVSTLDDAAGTDPLTGVGNRRAFDSSLARLPVGGSVVVFDLDGFKPANDQHGHAAGDAVLRVFAATLHDCIRDGDLVARIGGDEFAVVLPSAGHTGVDAVLARLTTRWSAPHGVTFSTGRALLGPDDTVAQMMIRADVDLYRAKRASRTRS
jgi:diguanylate cyclase (GGDEF)-like protein